MADNVVVSPASAPGGATVACDDIDGVQYQRVKIVHGADGVSDGDTSVGNPLPVKLVSPTTVATTHLPPNATFIRRFGVNSAVGTVFEAIDGVGLSQPYMPMAAATVQIHSTSAADAAAGAGARTVMLTGLDYLFNQVQETISLTGLSPTVSATYFFRVTKLEVITVGTYGGSNTGTLTVEITGTGTVILQCVSGDSQTLSAHFCVPQGYYGFISGAILTTDSNKPIDIRVITRDHADQIVAPFAPFSVAQAYTGLLGVSNFTYDPPIQLSPTTDVFLTAKTATGTATVSVEYWGYTIPII